VTQSHRALVDIEGTALAAQQPEPTALVNFEMRSGETLTS
jgi:hypothetical protein